MTGRLSTLLFVLLSFVALTTSGQTAKEHKTSVSPDTSKAHAWAERVTNFVANPRLGDPFRAIEVAERFKPLIPVPSLHIINDVVGSGSNPENGIVDFEYNLDDLSDDKKGSVAISWLRIYLPRTDPDGVDVFSRVKSLMKQKLPRPWRFYVHPNQAYYWEQHHTFSTVDVELVPAHPNSDGPPSSERWVAVEFGRVDSFEKGE